jgi:hypothetical protein
MDTNLRKLGQREIYLREKMKSLIENTTEPLAHEQQTQLPAWQAGLEDLARDTGTWNGSSTAGRRLCPLDR